ncbi:MAG: hypothetical protein AB1778_00920 [Candidatus Bipolaricaulota bacterium]
MPNRPRRHFIGRDRRSSWPLLVSLGLVTLIGPAPYVAGLTVSVSEFDLAATPCEQRTLTFVVLNDEPRSALLEIVIVDWDEAPDGTTKLFPVGDVDRSCGMWIAVPSGQLALAPFEEAEVTISLEVPPGVRGTYWSGLLVRAAMPAAPAAGLVVSREALVRLFFTVSPATRSTAVTDMEVVSVEPFSASVELENAGETRVRFREAIVTVEGPARAVRTVVLPATDVLPGRTVRLSTSAPWGLAESGIYIIRAVFDDGGETLIAGQIAVRVP